MEIRRVGQACTEFCRSVLNGESELETQWKMPPPIAGGMDWMIFKDPFQMHICLL